MSDFLKKAAAPLGSALMGLALVLAVSGASLVLTGNSAFAQEEDGGLDERVLVPNNKTGSADTLANGMTPRDRQEAKEREFEDFVQLLAESGGRAEARWEEYLSREPERIRRLEQARATDEVRNRRYTDCSISHRGCRHP